MIRALSYFQMPGRSCTREMRPVPIAPTLMRLLGELAPSTDAGTIDGKPESTEDATMPPPAEAMNSRRVGPLRVSLMRSLLKP